MNRKKIIIDREYKALLQEIKKKIINVQLKAVVKVNAELLRFYWEFGKKIVEMEAQARWGDGLIVQLSKDLRTEFPDMVFLRGISNIFANGIYFIIRKF